MKTDREHHPWHLTTRSMATLFALAGIAVTIACLSVGIWPLVAEIVIAILFLLLMFLFLRLLGRIIVAILLHLSRQLPSRFRAFATERQLHPFVVVIALAAFAGVLMLIFRDIAGAVVVGLLIVGLMVVLPMLLAEWSTQRRKKNSANKVSQATSGSAQSAVSWAPNERRSP